jgi:aspartyl-tRNA(Asn)/glutamyl-tRNA(Gln) amidotransferase subunit A
LECGGLPPLSYHPPNSAAENRGPAVIPPTSFTDEILRALLREYVGAEFSSAEIAELRPHIERQLAHSRALQALGLEHDDPVEMPYIFDNRLADLPEPEAVTVPGAAATRPTRAAERSTAPSPSSPLAALTIHELARLIAGRQVSPVEVTREALDRIAALDPRLNAFARVWPEQAMADARAAEDEIVRGGYRGPLHGVPLGIKDNIAVSGWPTTNASALRLDFVTDYDAAAVRRLREAGAIVIGKNNMHEWALAATSAYSAFGAVHNPWRLDFVPGGSSGGSAAAVSASLVYASLGTDNRGSVRTPASYCGVVGLKPTFGLVSRFGQLPPTSGYTDHIGPLTKDVADAALLLNAIAGYDGQDPTSRPGPIRNYAAGLGRGIKGLRLGVPANFFFEQADNEVRALVMAGVELLGTLGAEIREVLLPSAEHAQLLGFTDELRFALLPLVRRGPQAFADRGSWYRLIAGQFVQGSDVLQGMRLRNRMRAEIRAVMDSVDILATPTTATAAFPIAESAAAQPYRPGRLTAPFNFVGMPAISVPCGFTADRLPVGLTLAGRHWEDDVVLRVAHAYEQAASSGYCPPPLAEPSPSSV